MEAKPKIAKAPQKRRQAPIVTSGVTKTTPGKSKMPNNLKVPVNIHGRLYRDPKSADLTDIERAVDDAKAKVKMLEDQKEARVKAFNEKKKFEEREELKKQLKLELTPLEGA